MNRFLIKAMGCCYMHFFTDTYLVKKSIHDPRAFATIYDRYADQLYGFVGFRIASEQDREDLVSEIWLKVMEHLPRFHARQDRSFAAWLFRIARNHIIDFYRKHKTLSIDDAYETVSCPEPLPDEKIDQAYWQEKIKAACLTLPDAQLECVQLRYCSDLRNRDIAEVLKIEEKSVASNIARGLKKMKAYLKKVQ